MWHFALTFLFVPKYVLNVWHSRPGPLLTDWSSSQAEAQRDEQMPDFQGGPAAQIQYGPVLILDA